MAHSIPQPAGGPCDRAQGAESELGRGAGLTLTQDTPGLPCHPLQPFCVNKAQRKPLRLVWYLILEGQGPRNKLEDCKGDRQSNLWLSELGFY